MGQTDLFQLRLLVYRSTLTRVFTSSILELFFSKLTRATGVARRPLEPCAKSLQARGSLGKWSGGSAVGNHRHSDFDLARGNSEVRDTLH